MGLSFGLFPLLEEEGEDTTNVEFLFPGGFTTRSSTFEEKVTGLFFDELEVVFEAGDFIEGDFVFGVWLARLIGFDDIIFVFDRIKSSY